MTRRLACLSKIYGYGLEVGVLTHSPVPHVRRPKVSDDSASVGLSRDELGRVLDTATAHSPRASALVHLLAFNGLRIAEALNADIDDLIHDRGHRALRITRTESPHQVTTQPLPIAEWCLDQPRRGVARLTVSRGAGRGQQRRFS